jgi:hypothetical protein
MHRALVCLVIAACGISPATLNTCPVDVPTASCAGYEAGLACTYAEASGLTQDCRCETPFGAPTGTQLWVCNDCPWTDPNAPASCSQPGVGCYWTSGTDEMECGCECTASGWWSCTPMTSNSVCPVPPP